ILAPQQQGISLEDMQKAIQNALAQQKTEYQSLLEKQKADYQSQMAQQAVAQKAQAPALQIVESVRQPRGLPSSLQLEEELFRLGLSCKTFQRPRPQQNEISARIDRIENAINEDRDAVNQLTNQFQKPLTLINFQNTPPDSDNEKDGYDEENNRWTSKAPVAKEPSKEEQNQVSTDFSDNHEKDLKKWVALLSGNKLGDLPSNQYLPSRTELENQLTCTKHDLDIVLSSGIQLGTRCNLLIKNNESFSEHICQLENEIRELKNQITHKNISLTTQDELLEMKSLKNESELENTNLFLAKLGLEKTLSRERNELTQIKDDLVSARKALSEKDLLFQEANACLAEQILKASSKTNGVIGGVSGLEKVPSFLTGSQTHFAKDS
ncbi:3420_t:CDS:2, partial [Gigaspora rosea]